MNDIPFDARITEDQSAAGSSSWTRYVPLSVLIWIAALSAVSLVMSLNWPFVHDALLMHYVVFLMNHGFRPYRDIFDMNMPGTYLIHWLVFHSFGGNPVIWRCFDLVISAIAAVAVLYITRPYDHLAGWIIAGILILDHLSVNVLDVGQRDYILAVFLLVAYAFVFAAVRRSQPYFLFFSGFLFVWSTGIKLTPAPLTVLMLALPVYIVAKRGEKIWPYILSAVLGCACATGIFLGFLLKEDALGAFIQILFGLVPYHAGLGNTSWTKLLLNVHQMYWALTLIVGFLLLYFCRCWDNWEQWAILLGAAFGILSYVVQRKGWHYHESSESAFLYLWIITLCLVAIRTRTPARLIAATFLLFIALVIAPILVWNEHRLTYSMASMNALRADLRALGGRNLDSNIQCFDWGAVCLGALYYENLTQSTGAIYDFYLFPPKPNSVTPPFQEKFFASFSKKPPKVLVIGRFSWPPNLSFERIESWPLFAEFLQKNYRLDTDVSLQINLLPDTPYRIYLRNAEASAPSR